MVDLTWSHHSRGAGPGRNERPTLLLGLFRGSRFSYARAVVIEELNTSFIAKSVADDLRCYEDVEQLEEVTVEVEGEGGYTIFSLCLLDRVVFNGNEILSPTVVHVARFPGEPRAYEAFVGKDLIAHWQLYVDPAVGLVRSRLARRVVFKV